MAGRGVRRNGSGKPDSEPEKAVRYTKEQLSGAEHFRSRKDLVEALLENGREYTVSEADQVIYEFMKGKVSLC